MNNLYFLHASEVSKAGVCLAVAAWRSAAQKKKLSRKIPEDGWCKEELYVCFIELKLAISA